MCAAPATTIVRVFLIFESELAMWGLWVIALLLAVATTQTNIHPTAAHGSATDQSQRWIKGLTALPHVAAAPLSAAGKSGLSDGGSGRADRGGRRSNATMLQETSAELAMLCRRRRTAGAALLSPLRDLRRLLGHQHLEQSPGLREGATPKARARERLEPRPHPTCSPPCCRYL